MNCVIVTKILSIMFSMSIFCAIVDPWAILENSGHRSVCMRRREFSCTDSIAVYRNSLRHTKINRLSNNSLINVPYLNAAKSTETPTTPGFTGSLKI
jgi:hypothetical protein